MVVALVDIKDAASPIVRKRWRMAGGIKGDSSHVAASTASARPPNIWKIRLITATSLLVRNLQLIQPIDISDVPNTRVVVLPFWFSRGIIASGKTKNPIPMINSHIAFTLRINMFQSWLKFQRKTIMNYFKFQSDDHWNRVTRMGMRHTACGMVSSNNKILKYSRDSQNMSFRL